MTGPEFADSWSRFIRVAEICQRLVDEDRLTWRQKYDAVFSDYVAGRLRATGLMPEYYNPDMDYEDDVRAFNDAVQEQARAFRIITAGAGRGVVGDE